MKKILILGGLSVLLIIFGYFFLFSGDAGEELKTDDTSTELEQEEGVDEVDENLAGVGSLAELRALSKDLECNIVVSGEASRVEGTYFVSGGDIRGDFLTFSNELNQQILSSMIVTGNDMYVWSEIDGKSYGVKFDTSLASKEEVSANEPVSLDEKVRYSCQAWRNVDRSIFIPAPDVLFSDMNTIMQAGMEYGTIYEEQPLMEF